MTRREWVLLTALSAVYVLLGVGGAILLVIYQ